jgi:hypothetical protein
MNWSINQSINHNEKKNEKKKKENENAPQVLNENDLLWGSMIIKTADVQNTRPKQRSSHSFNYLTVIAFDQH